MFELNYSNDLNAVLNYHEFVECQMAMKLSHFREYILKFKICIIKINLPSITGTIFKRSPISTTIPVVTSYEYKTNDGCLAMLAAYNF